MKKCSNDLAPAWASRLKRSSKGAWGLLLLAAIALWSCAAQQSAAHRQPPIGSETSESVMACDMLYFGLATPQGEVTEGQWQTFLDEVVTPRFPEGLTSWEAKGQWMGRNGSLVRERSKVLQILHPPSARDETAVAEIIAQYKRRFQQESVMRVRTSAGVSF